LSIGESYFWLFLGSSIKGKVKKERVTKERRKIKERVPHAFKLLFHLLGRE
jgi:hypothetical protein